MLHRRFLTSLLAALVSASALCAGEFSLVLLPGHQMRIEGSSNIRQWDADVEAIGVEFALQGFAKERFADLQPEMFKALKLHIAVADVQSRTRGLSGHMHKHLKKDEYPAITFELQRVSAIHWDGASALLEAEGILRAAGKDHGIAVQAAVVQSEDGDWTVSGTKALKMTDFAIDPPTAIFGAVRAADEIEIHFRLHFRPQALPTP